MWQVSFVGKKHYSCFNFLWFILSVRPHTRYSEMSVSLRILPANTTNTVCVSLFRGMQNKIYANKILIHYCQF